MAIKYRLHGYESERGWGRSFDFSDYDTREQAKAEMIRLNALNNLDTVPDWYYVATHIEIVEFPDETPIVKDNEMSKNDREYRDSMDVVMTELGETLLDIGAVTSDGAETDAEIVAIATRKIKVLADIAKASLTPGVYDAIMKNN